MSNSINKKTSEKIEDNADNNHKIYKKGVHFNEINIEDRIILDYLVENNINFSALTKQLMMQFINEKVVSITQVKKISRKEIDSAFKDKIVDEAFQNQIRKIVIETLGSLNITSSSEVTKVTHEKEITNNKNENAVREKEVSSAKSENEIIIDKAVSSYTDEDINAMSFNCGRD